MHSMMLELKHFGAEDINGGGHFTGPGLSQIELGGANEWIP